MVIHGFFGFHSLPEAASGRFEAMIPSARMSQSGRVPPHYSHISFGLQERNRRWSGSIAAMAAIAPDEGLHLLRIQLARRV
jgi:hypothetical protein